jgi:hypothetical protein
MLDADGLLPGGKWVCVGEIQGRGRLGDHRLGQLPVKTMRLAVPAGTGLSRAALPSSLRDPKAP